MTLLDLARRFKFVRELSGNKGQRVEGIQRWSGLNPGTPWCAAWVSMVMDLYYMGKAPLVRSGSCDVLLANARAELEQVSHPVGGDLYFRLRTPDDAVHIGFVTRPVSDGKFGQLSGNTSADGLSNNGDGVYERDVPYDHEKYVFYRLPA